MREDITRDAADATRPETDMGNARWGTAAKAAGAGDSHTARRDGRRPGQDRQVREGTAGKVATLADTVREKTRRQASEGHEQAAVPSAKAHGAMPQPVRRAAGRETRRAAQTVGARPALLYSVGGLRVLAGLWIWRRGSPG